MRGDAQSFSEGRWAVEAVMSVQATMAPFDDFLSFVSSASNPASVLHFLVPVLALFDQALALQIVVAYVAADVSNLAFKWPLQVTCVSAYTDPECPVLTQHLALCREIVRFGWIQA